MTRPPSILFLANLSGFHAKIPCAVPFSISPSISLKTTLPGSLAVLLSYNSFSTKRLFCLANSRSSVNCASIESTWRSSSSDDLRQYMKYLIIASGIKLIKALHLHRQFLKISPHRLLRLWRNPNFVWEPPTFGGNAFGGIQNPLEFLGGNQCRGAKPRGNFFGKSEMVGYSCNSSDGFRPARAGRGKAPAKFRNRGSAAPMTISSFSLAANSFMNQPKSNLAYILSSYTHLSILRLFCSFDQYALLFYLPNLSLSHRIEYISHRDFRYSSTRKPAQSYHPREGRIPALKDEGLSPLKQDFFYPAFYQNQFVEPQETP